MNTKQQGDIGVAFAIAYYTKAGYGVCTPLTDNLRYDLIVDDGSGPKRVQVKTTRYKEHCSYVVNVKTCGGNKSGNGILKYISEIETDLVFVYCEDGTMYEFPAKIVAGKGSVTLSYKCEPYKVSF